jgi:sporulation protein YlmC with PRC-barrel domain
MLNSFFLATALSGALIAFPALADSNTTFVKNQALDQWRASKLVGVSVMGADQKKIGKIEDVLIDHSGAAQTVVIGVGGFLGIGTKDVAVPFNTLKWRTEGRAVAVSTPPVQPSAGAAAPAIARTDPAATEASQGYPDMAMLDMTKDQLKNAPDFHYAPSPAANAAAMPQSTAPAPLAPAPPVAPKQD